MRVWTRIRTEAHLDSIGASAYYRIYQGVGHQSLYNKPALAEGLRDAVTSVLQAR